MGSLLIENASVVTPRTIEANRSVFCGGGKIIDVCGDPSGIPADVCIDAGGMLLCPGFIDLHMHGVCGLLCDAGKGQLEEICRVLPRFGVTGFLPGICPASSEEEDIALLEELSQAISEGAGILGFFLEGHYLALTGAISHLTKNMDKGHLERLIGAAAPYKPVFAVSPELEGIAELLPCMTASGYPAFITHTAAGAEETEKAIKAGATHATHFYDVFPYCGDKEPGVRGCGAVEAVLANPEASVDFILDGEHVDPIAVKMAIAAKGPGRVSLITDSNLNAGMPPGRYIGLGGSEIEVLREGGPARFPEGSPMAGGLVGSGLTMDVVMRNAIEFLGIDIPQAVAMVSSNPASVLGLKNKGRVEKGFDADLVLLDKSMKVSRCWVGGELRFKSPA